MASGAEMMMNSLLKAMGFDPRDFVQKIDGFLVWTQSQMKTFTETADGMEKRIHVIENEIAQIRRDTDLILAILQGKVIDHGGRQNHFEWNHGQSNRLGSGDTGQSNGGHGGAIGSGDGIAEQSIPD